MDDQSAELLRQIKSALKEHQESNKTWQTLTLLLPVLATTVLGILTYGWNAKAQEQVAVNQAFYTHKLTVYETIDDQTGQLVNALEALEGLSSTAETYASKKAAAQNCFGELTVPIAGLTVIAEVATLVDDLQGAALDSPLLGFESTNPDNIDTIKMKKQQLVDTMKRDLGVVRLN